MNLSNLHEMCREIVNWAGSCPEATVSAWLVSIVMTVTQLVFLGKRLIVGKGTKEPEVMEIATPVLTPYVPGDTVLKILKLLNDQDNGWKYDINTNGYDGRVKEYLLNYGSLGLSMRTDLDKVYVQHKGVHIDLEKRSEQPDLDRILLRDAFHARRRKEAQRHQVRKQMIEREAEMTANRELTDLLENCV